MKKKMSTKKMTSIVVVSVLVFVLAIGVAYAWTDYTQIVLNTFDIDGEPTVLLHDDFDGENKDVYVENTGNTEIFVRVKFVEYLQLGNESLLPAFGTDSTTGTKADPDDKTTWPTHQFTTADMVDNKCSLISHDYFRWNMSGAQREYLAGVYDGDPYGRGGLTQDEFDNLTLGEEFTLDGMTTKKLETLEQSDIMMLSTWLGMTEKPEKACWLLDTDGWAYWSAPLAANTATNLLLDSVEETGQSFYDKGVYHIAVQLQAATLDELHLWYANGKADVADPDNSVATVTDNGEKFIMCMKGEDVTYEWRVLSNNIYQEIAINHLNNNSETTTGNYKLAGNDENIATEADNNMLAGRSLANDGGIEIGTIDVTNKTYTIKNADTDYVVTMGIDNMLGTYDDVITSKSGALGKYDLDGDDSADNIGWNYLYGPLDNMLVATEYVLDNVMFNSVADENGYKYEDSELKEKMDELWESFGAGMKADVVNMVGGTDNYLDMSAAQHTGNQVRVCATAGCNHSSGCSLALGMYYTETAAQSNIDLGSTKFFALSLTEILTAYGDSSTDTTILRNRTALYASKWSANTYSNAYGVSTANYWLRSPGYSGTRAVSIRAEGYAYANNAVTNKYVGARPACYLDLTSN